MEMMERHKRAISSVSLGWHASHTLERKISAVQAAGYQGIELFITDLDAYVKAHRVSRIESARRIKQMCADRHIEILCLGSFDNFEGQPSPLQERLKTAAEWLEIANTLGTIVIQIPSNDNKEAVGDVNVIVGELRALADLGAQQSPPITFAYEALAWGTHVADWEESLRIVELVDRANFGLCLDTYHVVSRLWADPRSKSGIRAGGDAALRASIDRFNDHCPPDKIVYIQLSDAEKLSPPLLPGHPAYDEDKDGPHAWCSYGRLFPLEVEEKAYFPMQDICRAWLVQSGWSGWVSMEIFHRKMKDEAAGPELWAERGRKSWEALTKIL